MDMIATMSLISPTQYLDGLRCLNRLALSRTVLDETLHCSEGEVESLVMVEWLGKR